MPKSILKYILPLFIPSLLSAQLSELGIYGGTSNFVGDVGSGFVPSGYSLGMVYRYQFNTRYSIRFQGMYGMVSADDAQSQWSWKQNRNQSFESNIIEGAAIVEFNFFEYVTGSKKMRHSPYIFAGVGLFSFNPVSYFDGERVELQPLGTEGQGSSLSNSANYGLTGLILPFGLGYRVSAADNISFSFEIGFRSTTTDYLDDVSDYYVDNGLLADENGELAAYFADRSISDTDKSGTMRGDPNGKDWYIFSGVTMFVALTPQRERCKRFR